MKAINIYSPSIGQLQTQDISPLKKSQQQTTAKQFNPLSQLTTQHQTSIHTKKVSRTQEQIYSHDLISSIMNKRHNNTVMHKVGQFNPDIQLYGKPKNPEEYGMLEFSDQRQMYQSQYTKRITDINRKLNCGKSLTERLKNRKQQNNESFYTTKPKRPVSAKVKNSQNVHKKISVSGLVSYNFNSVNARKSLGFDFERDQDKLNNILRKLQNKSKCCATRQHSLIKKKKYQKAKKQSEIKHAIFCDFETKTKQFLGNLHEQIIEQEIIYGMKWSKILCIKQLMEKQQIPYSQAESIVNQIEQKKQIIQKKETFKKKDNNDDNELNNRRQIVQRGRVMLKNLYFMD